MDIKTHHLCETVQEVTLAAWPVVYGDENKYDLDSRDVLLELRLWAEEFENWWDSHDEDWMDSHDYVDEVAMFTDKKCKKYLSSICW